MVLRVAMELLSGEEHKMPNAAAADWPQEWLFRPDATINHKSNEMDNAYRL